MLGLSGCVTGYGYSDDGYYYGRPSASVGSYGSIGYGTPGGWGYGYGLGYGAPGYYGYLRSVFGLLLPRITAITSRVRRW